MEVFETIADVRDALNDERRRGRSIALVPTMGFLHEGHMTLMREGRKRANLLVVTIFVNPTQFGPEEDLDAYPRDTEGDTNKCRQVGAHVVFMPRPGEMYLDDARTTVTVAGLTDHLCGAHRPVHFQGVTTVVTKLFNIIQPDVAIFGEKDYQQLAVIRKMVRDLNMPVEVVGVPTVRESDGLAMSSRNAYLSSRERSQAPVLIHALTWLSLQVAEGVRDVIGLKQQMWDMINEQPDAQLEYLSFVHPETLVEIEETIEGPTRVAIACYVGKTRLIDNILVHPPTDGS